MRFSHTEEFRTEATRFKLNGMYCQYPSGTAPHREYWEKQDYYCRFGFKNSVGLRITGPHYFYLNFIQILAKEEDERGIEKKFKRFPDFLDIDYDFFINIEEARRTSKGLCLVKPRRTGFSLKMACIITHEYNFTKDSKCFIGSFLKRLADTTMSMVLDNLNFLDTNTEWKKQRSPDTSDFIKARYKVNIGGVDVWKGIMSEVYKVTFKDNPFAAVGKSSSIFLWEEAGTFENLINSYNLTEPCWKDGDSMIGVPVIQGTGGDMTGGTRDLHEMFYNPKPYSLLQFNNVWEEGKEQTTCGWFIPATRGKLGKYQDKFDRHPELKGKTFIDKDGNSNEEFALMAILEEREMKRMTGDSKAIRDSITQYPLTPNEAFLRNKGNIFPAAELAAWLAEIETSTDYRNAGSPVQLYFDQDSKIKSRLETKVSPIIDFPLKSKEGKEENFSKEGCIVIYEQPDMPTELIPYGLYIAGCDPYDQDKSETGSLGSIFIYKTFYRADKTSNRIVAEYTGRPEFAADFYENCRKLLLYYNAKCLYENQLKGLKGYFEQKHCLHLLYEQPQIIKDIVKDSKVSRGFGIHMNRGANGNTGIKDQCEIYLKKWLLEDTIKEDGTKVLNIHTIFSQALLKELIAYDRENNFDRVIAFMLCILQLQENHKVHVEAEPKRLFDTDPFFKKVYFKKHTESEN